MSPFIQGLLGQFVALATFFAFPAIQYIVLKRFARRRGQVQLWYVPPYGFRLVAHNISGKRTLSELRFKTVLRNIVEPSHGASVKTFDDHTLVQGEEMFLMPGTDQILLAFRVELNEGKCDFIVTDKLGRETNRLQLASNQRMISQYSANVENVLNFDFRVARRLVVHANDLMKACPGIQRTGVEQLVHMGRLRDLS